MPLAAEISPRGKITFLHARAAKNKKLAALANGGRHLIGVSSEIVRKIRGRIRKSASPDGEKGSPPGIRYWAGEF